MSFADEMRQTAVEIEAESQALFLAIVAEVKTSIVEGSPLTGAPGQPVDEGNLRTSWELENPEPGIAILGTNALYAASNEDGIARPGGGPYRLLSKIGGRHSVALTIAGIDNIIADVQQRFGR